MNWHNIYQRLINRAKGRTITAYKERHHIIPRCMGGTDDAENLVDLTAEEHFVAHQLLIKMYPGNHQLVKAAILMTAQGAGQIRSNKAYGWLRRKASIAQSVCQTGSGNSQFGTMWITNGIQSKKIQKDTDLPEGWTVGRKIPQLTKPKLPSKCRECNQPVSSYRATLCKECFLKTKSKIGRINIKKAVQSYSGRNFITNDIRECLHPIEEPLPAGYRLGRLKRVGRGKTPP